MVTLIPFLAALLAVPITTADDPAIWQIDVVHSDITFRVRHFVTKVPGTFTSWQGTITADPANLGAGSVEVSIDVASVSTRNDRRDAHLRPPDFFAADSFPTMTFKSTQVEVNGSELKVAGDLTIKGKARSVVLIGEYAGTFGPPQPRQQRIGFNASTKLNRLDCGLKWNRLVDGTNMLGDEVDITINFEAVRTN